MQRRRKATLEPETHGQQARRSGGLDTKAQTWQERPRAGPGAPALNDAASGSPGAGRGAGPPGSPPRLRATGTACVWQHPGHLEQHFTRAPHFLETRLRADDPARVKATRPLRNAAPRPPGQWRDPRSFYEKLCGSETHTPSRPQGFLPTLSVKEPQGAVRTLPTGVSGGFACGQRASDPPSHVGVQSQQFGTTALTVDCRPISLGRICRMGQLGRPGTSPSQWGAGLPGNSGRRSWLGLSGPHTEGLGQTGDGRPSTPVPAVTGCRVRKKHVPG